MHRFPFLLPTPPKLSDCLEELRQIEASRRFTNFGPVNTAFEAEVAGTLFGGSGAATTVANATLGLMLCIAAVREPAGRKRRFAVLPSFTFAATAQAALWCGLELLFCDVEAESWNLSAPSVRDACRRHPGEIAVILPCTTFGNPLDLAPFQQIAAEEGAPLVIDAAAALGSSDQDGSQFGSGSEWPVVFSLHATKTFATGEGGLVYSTDKDLAERIRAMSNFGFDETRESTMLGLNAKMTEHAALLCLKRLEGFGSIVDHRQALYSRYRENLPRLSFQESRGATRAYQFAPLRIAGEAAERDALLDELGRAGVEARKYFSPHLRAMPFFRERSAAVDLAVTEWLSDRVVSLPIHDTMSVGDVDAICEIVEAAARTSVAR